MIEAFPDVVVPGHESVVILLKHSPRLELHEDVNNSSGIHDKRDSNSNTKQNEKLALVALLRIFTSDEKGNKNIIHEKTWKINQNELWDDSSSISFYKEREHRSERGMFLWKKMKLSFMALSLNILNIKYDLKSNLVGNSSITLRCKKDKEKLQIAFEY